MCGINLILDFAAKANVSHIQLMIEAVKHRGPDSSNFLEKSFGKSSILLGSNRLKIIDKNEDSNQPFLSNDGRFALIFNGEIYNHEELRNQLITNGVLFKTHSDTEVLLYWLIHKGKNGITDLNGMFAFVFVDFEKSSVIVARDSIGIKPLFIHQSKSQLIISSEIKGILASGLVVKELNEHVINNYLAYKYALRPATFFKGIEEAIPGSIWQVDSTGKVEKSTIPEQSQAEDQDIKQLLIDSTIQQYSSVNNTGIMLSGGVDSTLLLAILNKELGLNNIPVYSVVSTEKQNKNATQDNVYAKKAAKLFNATHYEIGIDKGSLGLLDDYIKTIGQPIADSGGFLTWIIAKEANGKSKVLLSGAGADELFAGYNRHLAFYSYLKHRTKKWFPLLKRGKNLPFNVAFLRPFKKLANSINSDASSTFNNFIQSDTFRLNQKLWENDLSIEAHLRNALSHDQSNYLSADVLAITDQSTMQQSIETRVPYLGNNIIQATRNLPADYLLKKGSKWMLKEILTNYGGKQFANRKKQGLGLPMDNWLRNNYQLWEFNKKENLIHRFINADHINKLLTRHSSGKSNLTQELWRILLLHKWLNHNFT